MHGHARLQDHRSGVHALVDEVHGGAGDLDAVLERLALGGEPWKRRQERGVDVQDPSGIGTDEPGRQDPHEAREAHEADPSRLELADEGEVVGLATGKVLRIDETGGDAGRARSVERLRPLAIADHGDDPRGKAGPRARLEDGLEVRPTARGEDAETERRRPGRHAVSSTPRSPATISPRRRTVSPASRRTPVACSTSLGGRTIT